MSAEATVTFHSSDSDSNNPKTMFMPGSSPENTDEDVWEDISEPRRRVTRSMARGPRPSSPASSIRSSPRKRVTFKTVFVSNSSSPRRVIKRKRSPPQANTDAITEYDQILAILGLGFESALEYSVDVTGRTIRWLRRPLSFFLFVWFLALITLKISNTLGTAFAPLCSIPIISSSKLCVSSADHPESRPPKWADYPKMIDVQSTTFEQLLDESVGGSSLALEIKKAEMATTDLVALVKLSELNSKDTLAASLTDFVEDAKTAGRGLQRLNAKVGGAVDGILAVNDYALHAIESAVTKSLAPKSAPSYVLGLVPLLSRRNKPTSEVVRDTFTEAMSVLSSSMQRLIVEASHSLSNLDNLEERLTALHEQVAREDSSISSAKSELLSELWTKLGGNKRQLRGYDEHLFLLKNLSVYRKKALVHVVAALNTLQGMSEDMEDLRERVSMPEIAGSSIPVEVHMRSIKGGLERLKEGRIKAKEREDEAVRRVLSISE